MEEQKDIASNTLTKQSVSEGTPVALLTEPLDSKQGRTEYIFGSAGQWNQPIARDFSSFGQYLDRNTPHRNGSGDSSTTLVSDDVGDFSSSKDTPDPMDDIYDDCDLLYQDLFPDSHSHDNELKDLGSESFQLETVLSEDDPDDRLLIDENTGDQTFSSPASPTNSVESGSESLLDEGSSSNQESATQGKTGPCSSTREVYAIASGSPQIPDKSTFESEVSTSFSDTVSDANSYNDEKENKHDTSPTDPTELTWKTIWCPKPSDDEINSDPEDVKFVSTCSSLPSEDKSPLHENAESSIDDWIFVDKVQITDSPSVIDSGFTEAEDTTPQSDCTDTDLTNSNIEDTNIFISSNVSSEDKSPHIFHENIESLDNWVVIAKTQSSDSDPIETEDVTTNKSDCTAATASDESYLDVDKPDVWEKFQTTMTALKSLIDSIVDRVDFRIDTLAENENYDYSSSKTPENTSLIKPDTNPLTWKTITTTLKIIKRLVDSLLHQEPFTNNEFLDNDKTEGSTENVSDQSNDSQCKLEMSADSPTSTESSSRRITRSSHHNSPVDQSPSTRQLRSSPIKKTPLKKRSCNFLSQETPLRKTPPKLPVEDTPSTSKLSAKNNSAKKSPRGLSVENTLVRKSPRRLSAKETPLKKRGSTAEESSGSRKRSSTAEEPSGSKKRKRSMNESPPHIYMTRSKIRRLTESPQ